MVTRTADEDLGFPRMVDILPEGRIGSAEITHFEIDQQGADFTNLRASMKPYYRYNMVKPGRYARLNAHGFIMMTDMHGERWSNLEALNRAQGRVLIAGLGLGMLALAMAQKPEVEEIQVVENNADVIGLVHQHLHAPKISIYHDDIFDFRPKRGERYDVIWFDIWNSVCADNLDQMRRLHRRFGRGLNRSNPNAWMASWRRSELQR